MKNVIHMSYNGYSAYIQNEDNRLQLYLVKPLYNQPINIELGTFNDKKIYKIKDFLEEFLRIYSEYFNDEKEYISKAAIYYINSKDIPCIIVGKNHADCIKHLSTIQVLAKDRKNEKQGFLTSNFRFVSRYEAYKIAKSNGQLLKKNSKRTLFSENVTFKE